MAIVGKVTGVRYSAVNISNISNKNIRNNNVLPPVYTDTKVNNDNNNIGILPRDYFNITNSVTIPHSIFGMFIQ